MNANEQADQLSSKDRELVDLVTKALVNPNLHTDTRMRLQDEITQLLRTTHEQAYGAAGHETHEQRLATHDQSVPKVLEAVLVDPNVHTDLRMRLHAEIEKILKTQR